MHVRGSVSEDDPLDKWIWQMFDLVLPDWSGLWFFVLILSANSNMKKPQFHKLLNIIALTKRAQVEYKDVILSHNAENF